MRGAAKTTIPAIVRASDNRDSLEVAIIENLQRENLNARRSGGFSALIDEYAFTQEEVAQRLGKSRSTVANAAPAVAARCRQSDARRRPPLGRTRARPAGRAGRGPIRLGRTHRERRAVGTRPRAPNRRGRHTAGRKSVTKLRPLSPEEHDFESRLRERFGTHVALVRSGRGGRIEFRFTNDKELIRLGDLLLGEE